MTREADKMANVLDRQQYEGPLTVRPPKMYVQDLKTLELLQAQYNPTSLERIITVDWAKITIPGLSHRKYQYNYTDNTKVSIEIVYDAMTPGCSVSSMKEATRFLESLCYTKKGAQNVAGGQPTRVLFKWPGVLSLTCVVTQLKIKMERFNSNAIPTYTRFTIALEEIRDARLFSEDVRNSGGERSPSPTVKT
jgi:Contractile injection system tube protein